MKQISSKASSILLVGFVLHAGSLCLPFLDQSAGARFLMTGLEQVLEMRLAAHYWLLFAGFYIPWLSLPVFIYRWFVKAPLHAGWYIAVVVCLLFPHIITIVRVIQWQNDHDCWELGYGCWFLSFVAVVLAFFYKEVVKTDVVDLSEHLVEED